MNTTTETSSIRDALESSFEANTEEQVSVAPESQQIETAPEGETEEQRAQREYIRDEQGKFAPKDAKVTPSQVEKAPPQEGIKAAPKVGQPPAQDQQAKVKDPIERAPQAWKPEAREFWKDIPPAARAEIIRHEQQVQATLRETADVRRFADAVQKTIAPFEHFIKAEGSNPVQAIDNLFSTAARLRTGTADELAGLVTGLINQFGVGRFGAQFIEKLDNALAGNAPKPENPEIAAMRQRFEQELAPLRQMQQQMTQQQQEQMMAVQQNAASEVEQFLGSVEFGNDVRSEMADIIDVYASRGQMLTLQQAYDIACRANPEINQVFQQREKAKIANSLTQTAAKAKQAAVSVGGSPGVQTGTAQPNSIREALEFAMTSNSR